MGKSDDLQKMRSAIEQGGGADKIKQQHDDGKEISYTTAADELGRTLSEIFHSETFTFSGVTTAGGTATWSAGGTVNKRAEIVVIKEADA